MNRYHSLGHLPGLLFCAAILALGCTLGPKQIEKGRRRYNDAIQQTDKEQLLLNLVRLKYRDSPLFLEVGSVSTQHSFSGTAEADLNLLPGADLIGFDSELSRTERPTVTYTPLVDSEFQKGLLAPIGQQTLVLVTQTGWSWDRVQRLTIKNINGLDNATSAGGPTPSEAPDFRAFKFVSAVFRELQKRGLVEIAASDRVTGPSPEIHRSQVNGRHHVEAKEKAYSFRSTPNGNLELIGSEQVVVLNLHPAAWAMPEMQEVAQLLRIQPDGTQYTYERARKGQLVNPLETDRKTLTVSPRSILEMMYFLSQAIEVPVEHMNRGLVTLTMEGGEPFDWAEVSGDILMVRSCKKYPECAEVAVPYRGYWFYIHESDLASKSTFDLLNELFNIEVRGGGGGNIPVLTLGL